MGDTMKYIKYMPYHSMKGASRNRREILAALESGYKVSVFSKERSSEGALLPAEVEFLFDGEVYFDYSMPKWKRLLLILRNKFTILRKTAGLDADVLSCHDIVALKLAYIATRFKKKKPKLVYDSHEFELGRKGKRNKLQVFYIKHWERFLMKRCAFSIMVNDSIADEVQHIHKLTQRPIVVRSTPEKWKIDQEVIQQVRAELDSQFPAEGTVLMYHGVVIAGRGIEKLLEIVKCVSGVNAVILGNGAEPYLSSLKKLAEEYRVTERVLFHPAVPVTDLWKYAGAADVGIILIPAVAKSYYYMLPNKLFENIQSGTPVIGSNFPEIKKVVNQYGIGLLCDPENTEEICACVEKMRTDKAFYEQCKKNTLAAKEDLCWEKEKDVLKAAFRAYL